MALQDPGTRAFPVPTSDDKLVRTAKKALPSQRGSRAPSLKVPLSRSPLPPATGLSQGLQKKEEVLSVV